MVITEYIKTEWDNIEKFIIPFQKPEIIDLFKNGYCYYFAKILKTRFCNFLWHPAEIYYNPIDCHFACLIGNKLWDVTGCISDIIDYGVDKYDNWYRWNYYIEIEPRDSERVVKNCIYKN